MPGTQKSHAFFGAFLREISLKIRLIFRKNLPRFHGTDIAKTFMLCNFEAHPFFEGADDFCVNLAQNCSHFFALFAPILQKIDSFFRENHASNCSEIPNGSKRSNFACDAPFLLMPALTRLRPQNPLTTKILRLCARVSVLLLLP